MNQILATNPEPKNKKKSGVLAPTDVTKIVKVFAIIMLLFGIFVIATSSYSLYLGEKESKNQEQLMNKPVISVENASDEENTVLLKVTSNIGIQQVVYQWNDGRTNTLVGDGKQYFEQKIRIPNGTNVLNITVTDTLGQESTYSKKYELNSNINLEATDEGKIKITYEGDKQISYMTYRWDDQEEISVDVNDVRIDYEIDTLRGNHTLTVIVVDVDNNTETKVQEISGVSIPGIEITFNNEERTAYVVKVTDDVELKEVIITLDEDENKRYGQKISGKEFQFEIQLKEGDNKMKVEVYNSDGQKAEKMVKYTK